MRLPAVFPEAVCEMLAIVGVPAADIADERSRMFELAFGRTRNRSLLGTMNDFERDSLDRFIERRNTIIHAGRGGATIVEADIRDALAFFESFGEAVGEIVTTRLIAES